MLAIRTWAPQRPSAIRILLLCVVEARPCVLGVSALRFLTGAALALPAGASPNPLTVLQGMAAWVLSILAIYLFNGVTDVTEDRINGSGRPIARGDLPQRTAALVVAAAAVLALAATLGLPAPMAVIIALNLVLGYLYSGRPAPLKDSVAGTLTVLCVSGLLSYLAGAVVAMDGAVGGTADGVAVGAGGGVADWAVGGAVLAMPHGLLVFAAAAISWMVLVGMPAKDLSDITGDAAVGRRTLGALVGERVSRRLMALAAVGVLTAFGVAVAIVGVPLEGPLLAMAAGVAAVVISGAKWLKFHPEDGDRRRRRRPYAAFMVTQHLLHIMAVLSVI
ncbi:UbiA family prenyltransferase [Microbispora sp. RL4-1S]|uniref:UbiA family prenyltransferase n=1 Tax=Microbispora oryzae TaxID=2806554 RepID=A0A940WLM1_9ACTN|nr:UbiA family prenyltransferase [Microbispora oryzae]MBP2707900.1 UbiA family prenyltransferase [Microbispora oryzae]